MAALTLTIGDDGPPPKPDRRRLLSGQSPAPCETPAAGRAAARARRAPSSPSQGLWRPDDPQDGRSRPHHPAFVREVKGRHHAPQPDRLHPASLVSAAPARPSRPTSQAAGRATGSATRTATPALSTAASARSMPRRIASPITAVSGVSSRSTIAPRCRLMARVMASRCSPRANVSVRSAPSPPPRWRPD